MYECYIVYESNHLKSETSWPLSKSRGTGEGSALLLRPASKPSINISTILFAEAIASVLASWTITDRLAILLFGMAKKWPFQRFLVTSNSWGIGESKSCPKNSLPETNSEEKTPENWWLGDYPVQCFCCPQFFFGGVDGINAFNFI